MVLKKIYFEIVIMYHNNKNEYVRDSKLNKLVFNRLFILKYSKVYLYFLNFSFTIIIIYM